MNTCCMLLRGSARGWRSARGEQCTIGRARYGGVPFPGQVCGAGADRHSEGLDRPRRSALLRRCYRRGRRALPALGLRILRGGRRLDDGDGIVDCPFRHVPKRHEQRTERSAQKEERNGSPAYHTKKIVNTFIEVNGNRTALRYFLDSARRDFFRSSCF